MLIQSQNVRLKMMRKIYLAGIIVLFIVLFFAWRLVFRFLPFMPHQRITISLPFKSSDDIHLDSINPMGETDNHPKPDNPHGHPGVDFLWNKRVEVIAVADGKISRIQKHKGGPSGDKSYDIDIQTGIYAHRYTELESYREDLKIGSEVKKGELIGYPFHEINSDGSRELWSIHFEFDYDTVWYDRLCPLTYFDPDARARVDVLWSKTGWTHNGKFLDFCSGDYKGRDK